MFCWGCSKPDQDLTPTPPIPTTDKSYYVSPDGDDSNPGTKEKPFRTLEKINQINLEPGEAIFLEGGKTFTGTLILDTNDNGSLNKPILINNYGSGTPIIDASSEDAVIIKSNYFRFSNINVKGAGYKEANFNNGIKVEKASDGIIENVITEGFNNSGLKIYNSKNIEVKKLVARLNGFSGIYVTGDMEQNGELLLPGKRLSTNIILRDCKAENNPGDPAFTSNHSGNGILIESTDKALIEYCTATNNGYEMGSVTGPIGIWTALSDSVTIQYCISYGNKSPRLDGGGFGLDGGVTNSVIQYCLSYNNKGAGYGLYHWSGASPWSNNTVRYSVSINDAINAYYKGITLWNGTQNPKVFTNCNVYNNVIYSSVTGSIAFFVTSNNENFNFFNNIFIGAGNIIDGETSGEKFLGNIYWGADGQNIAFRNIQSIETWANETGQEKLNGELKGRMINPMLAGPYNTSITDPYQLKSLIGYKLQNNSPVKDAGLNLNSLFGIKSPPFDFFGNPALSGSAPDPGIHELN